MRRDINDLARDADLDDRIRQVIEGYFRYTLRVDLDVDIPAAVEDIRRIVDDEVRAATTS